jgi:catechol 2,3-dioxygenase-like lactoylglutathione lyase family enzyme
MLHSLDHVIIAVSDLEPAAARMAALLGLRPSWRGEHPGAGSANVLFRLENTYLELLAPMGTGPVADLLGARLARDGEGLVGLAFGTADADACHLAWKQHGLDPAPPEPGVGRDVDSGAFREWRNVVLPPSSTGGVLLFAIEHRTPVDVLPPAAPAGDPRAAVGALDHVVVQTTDPEAARALYGGALGIRLALDRSFEDWGVRLLFFRVGGVTVEVAARLAAKAGPGSPEVAGARDRLWGLSHRVADADAARARVEAAGFDVSEVRAGRKPGTRVFSVRDDPCGVATLMLEPKPREEGEAD